MIPLVDALTYLCRLCFLFLCEPVEKEVQEYVLLLVNYFNGGNGLKPGVSNVGLL